MGGWEGGQVGRHKGFWLGSPTYIQTLIWGAWSPKITGRWCLIHRLAGRPRVPALIPCHRPHLPKKQRPPAWQTPRHRCSSTTATPGSSLPSWRHTLAR